MRFRARWLPIVLVLSVAVVTAAEAQREPCDRSPNQISTLLTVEGGGSLGVYEAGMTYVLVETFKRKWLGGHENATIAGLPPLCLSIATGASAGSINAFLATTSWCDARPTEVPEQSIFWRAWIMTGLMQLLPTRGEEHTADSALFSRRHFDGYIQHELKKSWAAARWIPGCHVEFGATATRLKADTVRAVGSIYARNQRMAFAFTLDGIQDSTPVMKPYVPNPGRFSFGAVRSLPVDASGKIPWKDAFQLIKTSSAFPVAFEPLPLRYCSHSDVGDSSAVESCNTGTMALDGGVFDNGPVAFAYLLSFNHELRTTAATVLYLSPDRRRRWSDREAVDILETQRATSALSPYGLEGLSQLAREMVPTARQYELQFAGRMLPIEMYVRMLEADARLVAQQGTPAGGAQPAPARSASIQSVVDSINRNFRTTARWHPLAGEWLGGFGGFFGRPLREYDFYVGMYDAFVLVAENLLCDNRPRDPEYWVQTSAKVQSLKQCVARAVRGLLDRPPIPIGDVAPQVLRALYHDEFVRPRGGSPLARPVGQPRTRADSTFVAIDGVREALYDVRMADATTERRKLPWYHPRSLLMLEHCRRPGLANAMFCGNGMVAFFDSLHNDKQAFAIMNRWSRDGECAVRKRVLQVELRITNAWQRPEACRTEEFFVRTAQDPEGNLYELSRHMLSRLEEFTPRGGATSRVSGAVLFVHATVGDRHRRSADMGPTSIPATVDGWTRNFLYLMPSSWGLTPNIRGLGEVGYEVRRHLGTSPLALSLPLHARPLSQIGTDGRVDHTLLIPGVRLEHKSFPLATRVGVQSDFWYRPYDKGRAYKGQTWGVFVSVLGKFNVSFTGVPDGLTEYRKQNSSILTFGLGDLNGLTYWLGRLMRK